MEIIAFLWRDAYSGAHIGHAGRRVMGVCYEDRMRANVRSNWRASCVGTRPATIAATS